MNENINDFASANLSELTQNTNELIMKAFKRGYAHGVYVGKSGGWVPVEDHLPPVGVRVFTCDDVGIIYSSMRYYGEGGWRWGAECESSDVNVVAWMFLPEPYKVKEQKPKTRAEKFYEMFPNCAKIVNVEMSQEMPSCCWKDIVGGTRDCAWLSKECYDCWNTPYDGEFEEEVLG